MLPTGGEASLDQVNAVIKALESTRPKSLADALVNAIRSFDQDGLGTVAVTDLSHVCRRS